MRCPNGYRQDPPKSGNCVKKTAKVTRKHAPNGTRKNKKLKQSSPKPSPKPPSPKMYDAKFMYVADKIFPHYEKYGMISSRYTVKQEREKIQNFINKNKDKIQPGDILFVGSNSDQEYGFAIIGNDYKSYRGDSGVDLPIQHRRRIPEHISYNNLLSNMGKSDLMLYILMVESIHQQILVLITSLQSNLFSFLLVKFHNHNQTTYKTLGKNLRIIRHNDQ